MRLTVLTLVLFMGAAPAVSSSPSQRSLHIEGHLKEIPDTGREWITLENGVEFQPADGMDLSMIDDEVLMEQQEQQLRSRRELSNMLSSSRNSHSGYANQFVDGSGTYYNDYAQAWRLLGFFTDCNAPLNNVNECYGDGGNYDGHDKDGESPPCQRMLLWAAYVDLDYEGGGIAEYQFYDRRAQKWDDTSCVAGNGRCAKMDCHLKNTHFKLLGFFKEPNYHEWMEQLFKHQGVCLWNDGEYSFMDTDRYLWPCYCTSTGQMDEDGNLLYYDTKPMAEGRIGLGLYTDSRCKYDYTGTLDMMEILEKGADKNDYGSVAQLKKGLEEWNDAFDVFKVCQPCKAYNLGYNKDLNKGNGNRQGGNDDDGNASPFSCYDDADYVNVNQCMKFRTKTEMLAAEFRDLMLAHQQGNIVQFEVMGKTYGYGGYRSDKGTMINHKFNALTGQTGIPTSTIAFFVLSTAFLIFALVVFFHLRRKRNRVLSASSKSWKLKTEPLVSTRSDDSARRFS